MIPSVLLLLAVPAVASAIGLPLMNAPQPVAVAIGIDAVRVAYIACLLVGVLLYYYTYRGRRLGRELIMGGTLLIVIAEFIIPAVIAGLAS